MARWSRAARLLPPDAERVLDIGCAFGYGTRRIGRGRWTAGVDVSEAYIRRAVGAGGGPQYARAVGDRLPFADGAFDAVTCLDVLEHVPDETGLLREARRVLRPGGTLLLSVPHRGLLARFDSINVYPQAWDMAEIAPGRNLSDERGEIHRHYHVADLRHLLDGWFRIEHIERTGIGVAELLNLPLLWLTKGVLRAPRLYAALQYLYFTAYLAEDALPMGRLGYHLFARAVAVEKSIFHHGGTEARREVQCPESKVQALI